MSKIEIIEGELTKDQLGLDANKYNELTNDVTTVINAAANVNHIGNYDYFYNDNVNTVKNLIEFCKKGLVGLAHISTVSVAGYTDVSKQPTLDFTENILYKKQKLYNNVYLITKLLAETEIIENLNSRKYKCQNI